MSEVPGEQPAAAGVDAGRSSLGEIASLFLRLGLTAFGGPAAHIALMEDEFVRRRGWLSHRQFLDMLGATNLIPGPNSTEMAIHIGHQRGGWKGLIVAGVCFTTPAVAITLLFAWAYCRFGSMPAVASLLYGAKPVIIAVVVQALWRLGHSAIRNLRLLAVALIAVAAGLLGANELVILLGAGLVIAVARAAEISVEGATPVAFAPLAAASRVLKIGVAGAVAAPFTLAALFLFFLKVGAVLFGSGYVLIAFLQADLVDRLHWLTQSQLLDAVAVGQLTPGPVFSAATFIGYLLDGVPGAIAATVGIFGPSFVFVALSRPLLPRLRESALAGAFLDGVNVGAVALMVVVTCQLARAAIIDVTTLALALVSAVLLIRFRINSAWVIVAGALTGIAAALW